MAAGIALRRAIARRAGRRAAAGRRV